MPLTQCSVCSREVSDKATRCPGCWAPIVTTSPKAGMTAPEILIVAGIIIALVMLVWWPFPS